MEKICILGAGSWGTAQAILLSENAATVFIWGRPEDEIDSINIDRENRRFLPGVKIPANVEATASLSKAMHNAVLVILAVPSQVLRRVLEDAALYVTRSMYIVNTAKGLEISTGMRMSQVVEDVLGSEIRERYAVLSGPSHAEEVAREVPTAVTVAAYRKNTAFFIQDVYMSPVFRVYTNPDVAGVELGGALKNIVALATGMADGLGYGDNTKAALITRGLTEMARMGEALGGDPRSFSGLSGVGDLVVTCNSRYSRNRRAGIMMGRGYSLEETLTEIGMVVEGVYTTKVVYGIACELGIDMPITEACYRILYEKRPPQEEVNALMKRKKKHEIEEIAKDIKGW